MNPTQLTPEQAMRCFELALTLEPGDTFRTWVCGCILHCRAGGEWSDYTHLSLDDHGNVYAETVHSNYYVVALAINARAVFNYLDSL